jgi:hypothetical protein
VQSVVEDDAGIRLGPNVSVWVDFPKVDTNLLGGGMVRGAWEGVTQWGGIE